MLPIEQLKSDYAVVTLILKLVKLSLPDYLMVPWKEISLVRTGQLTENR